MCKRIVSNVRFRILWLVVAIMILAGVLRPSAAAKDIRDQPFVCVIMQPKEELDIVYKLRKMGRSSKVIEQETEMKQPFFLYTVPKSINSYNGSKPYWKPEYRIYCIEGTGTPNFIVDGGFENVPSDVYRAHKDVLSEVEKTFEVTKDDWRLTAHALAYNRYAKMNTRYNQAVIYLGLNQTVYSRKVYLPKSASESLGSLSEKNKAAHNTHKDWNIVADTLPESRLMELRSAVMWPTKSQSMKVTKPGTYTFASVAGFAMPGMFAVSSGDAVVLPKEMKEPMKRDALLHKDEGYALTFTVPKGAKNGNYTIAVNRPDYSGTPEWLGYSSNTDLQKSGQWLGYVSDALPLQKTTLTVEVQLEPEPVSSESVSSEASHESLSSSESSLEASVAPDSGSQTTTSSKDIPLTPLTPAESISSEEPPEETSHASEKETPVIARKEEKPKEPPKENKPTCSSDGNGCSAPTKVEVHTTTQVNPQQTNTLTVKPNPLQNALRTVSQWLDEKFTPKADATDVKEDGKAVAVPGEAVLSALDDKTGTKKTLATAPKQNRMAQSPNASADPYRIAQTSEDGYSIDAPPITGDSIRLVLWSVVLLASSGGLLVMHLYLRRHRS